MVGQRHAPAALPPGNTRYPLYGRLGRSQGRSGLVRKISPPPGLDPRTDEPVASLYTDCAIPAHFFYDVKKIKSSPVYFSVFVFCVNLYLCFCVYICAFQSICKYKRIFKRFDATPLIVGLICSFRILKRASSRILPISNAKAFIVI